MASPMFHNCEGMLFACTKIFPVHRSYQVDLFFVSKVLTAQSVSRGERWLAAPLHGLQLQVQEEVGVAHLPCQVVQTFLV